MNAVDTNVLVHAFDESSSAKRRVARELLASLADTVLLWQVACEFIAVSRKSLGHNPDLSPAWARLAEFREVFPLVLPTQAVLDRAVDLQRQSRSQFWDALIYAACLEAGATRLYTEDVPGGAIAGLEVINPFG